MESNQSLKKMILTDCRNAMIVAIILYACKEIMSGLLMVYTANILGEFANAILEGNFSYGMQNFWSLLLCVCCTVLVLPLADTLAEVVIFLKSLNYCKKVLGRYFDKSYEAAAKLEKGETQYQLEDDMIGFYLLYTNLNVKVITIPFIFLYLVYHAGKVSMVYMVIVFMLSVIKLAVPILGKKKLSVFDKQEREYKAKMRSKELEMIAEPHMMTMLGIKNAWFHKLDSIYQSYYDKTDKRRITWSAAVSNIKEVMSMLSTILILLIGAVMVSEGMISPGAVAAMTGYFSVFYKIDEYVVFCIENFPIFKNSLERMEVIYEGQEKEGEIEIQDVTDIVADGLSFSYASDSEKCAFHEISFKLQKNTKNAITGQNGSGKTTLLKLLSGLLYHYDGSIRINGKELCNIKKEDWRKCVAYATQEPFLFKGSVKENIHLGNLQATEEDVEQLMEQLSISYLADREIVNKMEELSGGERQKISIARAMLKNAPVLILDEPDNHMDEETQQWLISFIREVPRTVLFVSHRNEMLQLADSIIKMNR